MPLNQLPVRPHGLGSPLTHSIARRTRSSRSSGARRLAGPPGRAAQPAPYGSSSLFLGGSLLTQAIISTQQSQHAKEPAPEEGHVIAEGADGRGAGQRVAEGHHRE